MRLRFLAKVKKTPTCWLWQGALSPQGYGVFSVGSRPVLAHRVSFGLYKGPLEPGKFVCHTCDVRPCVNPAHLFSGSPKTNAEDMVQKKRHAFGAKHGMAKLREVDVRLIRYLYDCGVAPKSLAVLYAVTPDSIRFIGQRKTWKYVSPLQVPNV